VRGEVRSVEPEANKGVAAVGLGLLTDLKRAGKQERAGSERDLSAGGEGNEDADDLRRQVVAGAIFDLVDLDGLGGEKENAGGGQGLADHEADEADALAGEGAEFVGNFKPAVADDRTEELAEFQVGHAGGGERAGREEGSGVAAEIFPASGGADPGDFSRRGRSLTAVGGDGRQSRRGE
jgi:hypothetical protein